MQPNSQLLGGRYELLTRIATGGMGQVWHARDTLLGREVAVKVLRSAYTGDPTFLARFRAEAQHSAALVHPNIAALFDYGEVLPVAPLDEHLAYLVMELVRGESLANLLLREGRLSPERTLDVLQQSAAGLAAAHAAGVVHRDVKPGNVLLGADGSVKITDFGVAVSTASVPLTQTGSVIGTPHYLSPERAEGLRATPASDVYALGMIGYECLAGHRAFDAESPIQIALMHIRATPPPLPDDVPEPVRRLIEAALVKDPTQRFPDGAAFRGAIGDVRAGGSLPTPVPYPETTEVPRLGGLIPSPAEPTGPPTLPGDEPAAEPASSWTWRRRLLVPLALLLALAVIAVGLAQTLDGGNRTAEAAAEQATRTTASSPPATAPAPTTPTVQPVELRLGAYAGRPFGEVQAELTDQGLLVTPRTISTADVPDGQVIALDPVGTLTPGTTVTVTYAVAPVPAPAPAPSDAHSTVVEASGRGTAVDPGAGSATGGYDDPGRGNGKSHSEGNGNGRSDGKSNGKG